MKKILFFILAVMFVIAVGCSGAKVKETPSAEPVQEAAAKQNGEQETQETPKGEEKKEALLEKLSDIFSPSFTGSVKCTYTEPKAGNIGIVWAKYPKMRIEVKSSAEDYEAITVSDGKMMYTWNPKEKTGVKWNLEEMAKLTEKFREDAEKQSAQAPEDYKEMYGAMTNYECTATVIPDSMFQAPSDVTFQDMTEMMKQALEMAEQLKEGGMPTLSCSVCENIPAESKASCLESCQ